MGKEISVSLQAELSLEHIINYLETEWSIKISESFYDETYARVRLIQHYPEIGAQSISVPEWRKILITKHNILVYRIDSDKITLLNIIDTRSAAYTV